MSTRKKNAPVEDGGLGVPAWMLTYADTVTLLMTFFVMLMGFSTLDEEEYAKVSGALQGHLGVIGEGRFNRDGLVLRRDMESGRVFVDGYENPPEYDPMSYMEENLRVRMRVQDKKTQNILEYRLTRQGFEVHILAGELFEPGTAVMLSEAAHVLDVVGSSVKYLPHRLRIQASGDMIPLRSEGFASRQDLAVARAASVCRYLAVVAGIEEERIELAVRVEPEDMLLEELSKAQVEIVVMRPGRKRTL